MGAAVRRDSVALRQGWSLSRDRALNRGDRAASEGYRKAHPLAACSTAVKESRHLLALTDHPPQLVTRSSTRQVHTPSNGECETESAAAGVHRALIVFDESCMQPCPCAPGVLGDRR